MKKIDEINDPNSCLNRANANEHIFTLLGRDICAAETIRFWCQKRVQCKKNEPGDAQILDALRDADEIEADLERKHNRDGFIIGG